MTSFFCCLAVSGSVLELRCYPGNTFSCVCLWKHRFMTHPEAHLYRQTKTQKETERSLPFKSLQGTLKACNQAQNITFFLGLVVESDKTHLQVLVKCWTRGSWADENVHDVHPFSLTSQGRGLECQLLNCAWESGGEFTEHTVKSTTQVCACCEAARSYVSQ